MCGICGIVSEDSQRITDALSLMNGAIVHRGPDDEGYYQRDNTGIAMRRLSIIDLATGHQPMFSVDKRFVIVFNGEIYNFKEVKDKYLSDYTFTTKSDTEVVLNLFHKFGSSCLEYLRGIFAFAIYDNQSKQLFIARDHIGVKPLYYYSDNKHFLFSSDIRSFHQLKFLDLTINKSVLADYLSLGYIPQPATIFQKVHKLKPGHFIIIKDSKQIQITPYYQLLDRVRANAEVDFETAKETTKQLLHSSVEEQMISDVPLGSFLSGGIDSSIITYEMSSLLESPVSTFTIGFKGASNTADVELSRIMSAGLKTNHHERIIEPEIDSILNKLIGSMGEPFAITSAIPIYINSKVARENVTVVLSGDGADEIFGGYERYQRFFSYNNLNWLRHLPLKQLNAFAKNSLSVINYGKLNKAYRLKVDPFLSFFANPDFASRYLTTMGIYQRDDISRFIKKDLIAMQAEPSQVVEFQKFADSKNLSMNSLMMFDCNTSLVDEMLTKVDFSSMLASIEVRVPFLDYRLVEQGLSLPGDFKINGKTRKHILKEAYKDILPQEILNAPKRGFNLPLDTWIKKNWSALFLDSFSNGTLNELGLEQEIVIKKFKAYLNGYPMSGKIFYFIFVLSRWYSNLNQN